MRIFQKVFLFIDYRVKYVISEDFWIEKARETRDCFQSMVGNPYNYVYEEHNEITTLTCPGNKYKAI